nr:PREDICTED: uncharacterized protein LOC108193204 [Daucus carota subsp. sativus]XP_017215256.1 PREDICTED: uncharacterized protein LOC108193204 [Daucus carota subsp. sativus]
MNSSGLIFEKFLKFLTIKDIDSDEIQVPKKILGRYGDRLPERFFFNFRNGYELPVKFTKDTGIIKGMQTLYQDFDLTAGEMLLFEYNGMTDLNVYVIGKDKREIDYPHLVHSTQKRVPRVVSMKNGGIRFINFVTDQDPLADEFEPPLSFEISCPLVPAYQSFVFSNGKEFEARYDAQRRRFRGLSAFCRDVGIDDFSGFNLLLFQYELYGNVTISAFDDAFVEVMFVGGPLSVGSISTNPSIHGSFSITVQPFHMSKYCYGVDISNEFYHQSVKWKKKDYIKVYSAEKAWNLQVRHRKNPRLYRTTIHDGWIEFRDDLGLEVGDVCVFESATGSYDRFSVRVVKKEN